MKVELLNELKQLWGQMPAGGGDCKSNRYRRKAGELIAEAEHEVDGLRFLELCNEAGWLIAETLPVAAEFCRKTACLLKRGREDTLK